MNRKVSKMNSNFPLGTPRCVIRGKVRIMLPLPLDPDRCWLLERKSREVNALDDDREMILTPACLSTEIDDEKFYMDFLNQFGWKNNLGTQPSPNPGRFFCFDAPYDLTKPSLVLETITTRLSDVINGETFLKEYDQRFRAGKLKLTFTLLQNSPTPSCPILWFRRCFCFCGILY